MGNDRRKVSFGFEIGFDIPHKLLETSKTVNFFPIANPGRIK